MTKQQLERANQIEGEIYYLRNAESEIMDNLRPTRDNHPSVGLGNKFEVVEFINNARTSAAVNAKAIINARISLLEEEFKKL